MIWSIDSTKKGLYQSAELDLIALFSPFFNFVSLQRCDHCEFDDNYSPTKIKGPPPE